MRSPAGSLFSTSQSCYSYTLSDTLHALMRVWSKLGSSHDFALAAQRCSSTFLCEKPSATVIRRAFTLSHLIATWSPHHLPLTTFHPPLSPPPSSPETPCILPFFHPLWPPPPSHNNCQPFYILGVSKTLGCKVAHIKYIKVAQPCCWFVTPPPPRPPFPTSTTSTF